jgi:EAL domain-containing protein (putative c-di-GMP-specific phosphodiesterase class I)
MRWIYPEWGFVLPGEFILLVEEPGMIFEMGRWVLKTGLCDHLAMLKALTNPSQTRKSPFVSVNVSGRQLLELSKVDVLRDIIENYSVNPSQIKLET